MAGTAIEWTQATWNPTTGCDRISAGCENCYALTMAARLRAMGQPKYQKDGDSRTSGPGFGLTLHEGVLDVPTRWASPKMIFVNSMSDLFHARVPPVFIERVFEAMRATPQHTYQVLTKRSSRLAALADRLRWPANLWVGVSVEAQRCAFRVDDLRRVPAAVRFISLEPLLGPVEIDPTGIDWVIAGGESGPRARPMDPEWVRGVRDQCMAEKVPFFFKQWGGRARRSRGRLLDGRVWEEYPRSSEPRPCLLT
ncbi:MAG: phage Gp37/Gp68 family protein [Actinomycetota bacterium]